MSIPPIRTNGIVLDLTGERIEIGQTDEFVTRTLRAWAEFEAFSVAMNNAMADMNVSITAINGLKLTGRAVAATQLVGNGASTSFPFNHGLTGDAVRAFVVEAGTGNQVTASVVTVPGSGLSTAEFQSAPAANEYRIIVTE